MVNSLLKKFYNNYAIIFVQNYQKPSYTKIYNIIRASHGQLTSIYKSANPLWCWYWLLLQANWKTQNPTTQFRTTLNCNNFKTTQKDVSLTSNKIKSTLVKALQMHPPRIKKTLRMQLDKTQIPSSNNKILTKTDYVEDTHTHTYIYICVCVCERERERENQ